MPRLVEQTGILVAIYLLQHIVVMDFPHQLIKALGDKRTLVERKTEDLHIDPEMNIPFFTHFRNLRNVVFTAGEGKGNENIQVFHDSLPFLLVQMHINVVGSQRHRLRGGQLVRKGGKLLEKVLNVLVVFVWDRRITVI